jgi:hypothetical protein
MTRQPRIQLISEGVIASYIHDISTARERSGPHRGDRSQSRSRGMSHPSGRSRGPKISAVICRRSAAAAMRPS